MYDEYAVIIFDKQGRMEFLTDDDGFAIISNTVSEADKIGNAYEESVGAEPGTICRVINVKGVCE